MKTLLFSLAALAATTSFARAQDQGLDPKATKAPELSTSAGVDFTTHTDCESCSSDRPDQKPNWKARPLLLTSPPFLVSQRKP